jgi:hypothetical protein
MEHAKPLTSTLVEYLDDRQLAQRTPFSRAHWQKMRQRGDGPVYRKVGRRCLYRWADVVAWIEAQPVGSAARGA